MFAKRRVILIIMDSVGAGELPDAGRYGDTGSHTLNHIFERYPQMNLPNLSSLGLASISGVKIAPFRGRVRGAYGKMAERSEGKDTITGHWEICGLTMDEPFRTFTEEGFPEEFIAAFEARIGRSVIGNYSASGTEIIRVLGEEHRRTGSPIVYTSADSVFQVAANVEVIPMETLYEYCEAARELLVGQWLVGRVIARPFIEKDGNYVRISGRHDYTYDPKSETILDRISQAGQEVCAVGKITDIFSGNGITSSVYTNGNDDGVYRTVEYMESCRQGLIFTNLIDFDSMYGHRRDPEGYGRALEEFDAMLPAVIHRMKPEDLLIICADHGNDPVHAGWNHTREYVPLLVYGEMVRENTDLGILRSFADVGASICEYLGVPKMKNGTSFLSRIRK
ncbi:MAG: phosphopentomutase [Anaerovoracaceae bacterium]